MFFLSRKDGDELFKRVRFIEQTVAVNQEHDKNLEELFKEHDKQEMIKYDNIQKRLDSNSKFQYMVVGGFILLETLHKFGIISF